MPQSMYPQASVLMTAETFDLLQLLPADQASAVKRLIQERGQLHPADGIPFRIYDVEYRIFPGGAPGWCSYDRRSKEWQSCFDYRRFRTARDRWNTG